MNPRASIITPSDLHCMLFDEDAKPGALPLSLLLKITNNFSDEMIIGSGGFAEVYKGMVENEFVAVKRLSEESMDDKEYERELECLLKVKHTNIVRFLGYCGDTQWDMRMKKGKIVKSNKEQRLLCFEYLPNGSLCSYIKGPSEGLPWRNRYQIIKGICEGIYYLHQIKIVHLDLKPGNILMDKNMVPKITDFGLSRCYTKDKTYVTATKEVGTRGYMAPEYSSKRITHKFDLYSLGVVIIEIMTGEKGHQSVEKVLESWSNMLDISELNMQWEQIRICAEIGIQCIESDPAKRPDSMKHIMDRLAATETAQLILAGNPSELLGVHPFALCFPFEPNNLIPCSLHLTNNTNEPVAFRLMKNGESWTSLVRLPLYGIVPPRSLYTLIVIAQEEKELPQKRYIDLILESTSLGDENIRTFQREPNNSHFEEAKKMGNVVQEVNLKAVYTLRRETITSSKAMSPSIKIMYYTGKMYTRNLYSLDTNQAKQWIIVGEDKGHVRIWNYQTQRKVDSIKVSLERVRSVKFIARKQWFLAGTDDGYVHVYSYEAKMQKIISIKFESSSNLSLAVHPTLPYLLSSDNCQMKVWDWDRGWECTVTFDQEHTSTISQVTFNPNNTIASASEDHTVKVWSLDSPKSNYTLSGHSNKVNCLDFFTCADQEYLVTGSDDRTGKIWDMEKRIFVYTLEGFMSPVVSVVYQRTIQTLITGSKDGLVYLWSTSNSRICSNYLRLVRIIDIGYRGAVHGLVCLMRGVVIGKENVLATMDIEQSTNDYSEAQFNANYTTISGDTSCKVMAGSNSRQPILDVHPQEFQFLSGRERHITDGISGKPSTACSLHLTNKTDEDVAFRLIDKRGNNHRPQYLAKLPLHGIVPPRSSYTLVVTTDNNTELQEVTESYLVLQSSILGDKYIVPFADQSSRDDFLGEAKELGHAHEVSLKAIFTRTVLPQEEKTSEILDMGKWYKRRVHSLDANQTKQWIITGGSHGHVGIWNYQTQRKVDYLKLSVYAAVTCVKFIARKQWFVAMTEKGDVHVYNYEPKIWKITSFSAGYADLQGVVSLAVHPTQPYLLTASGQEIKLWDWDKGWECKQISTGRCYAKIYQVAFNPKDTIVIASKEHEVEIRCLDSPKNDYTMLSGHSGSVNCLHFFTSGDQEYLVTGSDDRTAKIWDMEKKICVHTLEVFVSPVISVLYQPSLEILITGLEDGLIYLWSTANSRICSRSPRLKRIIDVGYGGALRSFACLMGRVVIGKEYAVTVAILDVENKKYHEESTDYSEALLSGDTTSKVMVGSSELLDIHPLELRFYRKPHTICSLHLTNKTDEHVAFIVKNKSGGLYRMSGNSIHLPFFHLPIYGTVFPGSTCHLIVKTRRDNDMEFPYAKTSSNVVREEDMVLHSSIIGDKNIVLLEKYKKSSAFFDHAKELGHAVHELAMKFVYTPTERETTFEPVIPPTMKIKSLWNLDDCLYCLDAHPTEPWIITGHYKGDVCIWNCDKQELVHTFKISEQIVMCVKFDARQQWIVVQTYDSVIHVYDCVCVTQMKKIVSFGAPVTRFHNCSIAINPIKPYVLSSSKSSMMLWDGDKGWECTQTFGSKSNCQAFNPEDPNSFANVSVNEKVEVWPGSVSDPMVDVQVWSLDSSEPNYRLSGHSETVNCLAYFTRGDRQYLITGSDDCTAKIWDLQKKAFIHTLEGFMSPVCHVISVPGRPYLVTCSRHGTIHVWSSIDFRLKTTVDFNCGGYVRGLACLMGSRRIAIGQEYSISIMDIDGEEAAVANEGNNQDSVYLMGSRRVVIGQENAISIMDIDVEEADACEGRSNIDIDNEEAAASGGANNENSDLYSCISWLPGILCSVCNLWS